MSSIPILMSRISISTSHPHKKKCDTATYYTYWERYRKRANDHPGGLKFSQQQSTLLIHIKNEISNTLEEDLSWYEMPFHSGSMNAWRSIHKTVDKWFSSTKKISISLFCFAAHQNLHHECRFTYFVFFAHWRWVRIVQRWSRWASLVLGYRSES